MFDVFSAQDYLWEVVGTLEPPFRGICSYVLTDKMFQKGCGGSEHHHNYEGGLMIHTAEIMKLCMANTDINHNVLATAVIWHDYHKIYEYKWNDKENKVDKLDYRKMIGHVAGSFGEFWSLTEEMDDLKKEDRLAIAHCMLSLS